ncbi:organic cation transporter protein-like, partial [Pectinophora gossypiella]|uniref:organic cation transporter protein-like n=1 Tax=Pectinophora gossypiella TaxID=13191 RepID=UPI00214F5238
HSIIIQNHFRFGRRKTLIFCVILQAFTGLMVSFVPEYWSFTIIRMILGFAVGGILIVGFVMVMEYVGHEYRDVVSALYHIPFTTGHILLALFGYLIRDYVYFQVGISLSSIILLTYICILPESPRWLLAVNRTTEAVQLMERIAKINNLPVEHIERAVDLYQLEHKNHSKSYVWDLFRTPNMRKNMLVMSFLWLVCSYYFYGVSYYICHLTGDLYINVAATGTVCVCSCLIAIPLMKVLKRKTVLVMSYSACSLCLLTIAAVPEGKGSIVLGCFGLLSSFLIFVVSYLYCSEMFPTVVRNGAMGIASTMARLGAMIAPFVATLRPYGQWCAPVAFGMFPLLAALLCFWLPETKGRGLMMTLEEGENFGKKKPEPRNETAGISGDIT